MQEKLEEQIKACIHCGMCLPACPTYNVSFNEANSPRGRIYLINDYAKQNSQEKHETQKVLEYLDDCLSCFACETVCPSNVDYANILDFARKDLKLTKYNKGFFAFVRKLFFSLCVNNRSLLRIMRWDLRMSSLWLRPMMSFLGFKNQARLIPHIKESYQALDEAETYYSDIQLDIPDEKRIINLSLGCVMDALYNHVHRDTVYVLNQFGFHVHISESKCCGSLAAHSGENQIAEKLRQEFATTVKAEGLPLITNSAGCGAYLKEHNALNVFDFIEAIKKASHNPLKNKTYKAEILYHPACHLNHRQGISDYYEDLLKSIPGLKVYSLDQKDTCCGSAGFYNLIKANRAAEIGELKAQEIEEKQIKTIVTANPGCMAQLEAHLAKDFELLHPASFLKRILSE